MPSSPEGRSDRGARRRWRGLLAPALLGATAACSLVAPSERERPIPIDAAVERLTQSFADLAAEASSSGGHVTVGVLDFSSREGPTALGYLLAHELSGALAREFRARELEHVSVITRLHVEDLLLEQGLTLSDVFAAGERPSVGQLLGADYLVTGLLTTTPRAVRVSAQFLSVSDGVTLGGEAFAIAPDAIARSGPVAAVRVPYEPLPRTARFDASRLGHVAPPRAADPAMAGARSSGGGSAASLAVPHASLRTHLDPSAAGLPPELLAVERTHDAVLVDAGGEALTDVGLLVRVGTGAALGAEPAVLARRAASSGGSRPIHVCLALDTSGSMSEHGRIEAARAAAEEVLDSLDDDDTVTLVTFAGNARVAVRPLYATPQAKNIVVTAMERLVAGGKTNFESALAEARRCFAMTRERHEVGYMVLLSDGMPTMGALDPVVLGEVARDIALLGVSVDTVGVGREISLEAMQTIAREGRGRFRAVDERMLAAAVRGSVAGAVDREAEAARLVFRPARGVQAADPLGAWTARPDGSVVAELGLVRRGEDSSRLLHVLVTEPAQPGAGQTLGELVLTYRDPYGESRTERRVLTAEVLDDGAAFERGLHHDVVYEMHRRELQTVLGQAYDMAVAGRLEAAAAVLAAAVARHEALGAFVHPATATGAASAWDDLAALVERARSTSEALASGRFPLELRSSLYRDAIGAGPAEP